MTDKTRPVTSDLPDAVVDAHHIATAETSDGRAVVMAQDTEGAAPAWFVPDARYSDGWREVTDRDEVGALVADINAHQAETAQPVTSGPIGEAGPELVKLPDGASIIGTGLASDGLDPLTGVPLADSTTSNVDLGDGTTPEDSTGGGADDPEGVQAGGEATPTAGTDPDDDEET